MRCLQVLALVTCLALACAMAAQTSPEAKGLRTVGVIKSLGTGMVTVTADSGEEVTASLQTDTRIVRIAPGQKDLKDATPLQVSDLQAGDRVLVRGLLLSDQKTIKAVTVIVMKQADVAAKQEGERADWQKRGVGGLVTAVDAATGTVTISSGVSAPGASPKTVAVHTTKKTILRRYAPNSIKYDDAKPAPFDQIKVGDQLRARGDRSADGNEFAADEIISGSFRNIAGLITSVDATAGTVTLQDVIAKKPVTVKVGKDSTSKKLPPEMAQRIAMRLKGGANGSGANGSSGGQTQRPAMGGGGGGTPGGSGAGPGGGGPPDLQRFLARLPDTGIADLKKGDAVMVVATEGGDGAEVTAVTLVAGVESILTAAPTGSMLSSWSLGSSMGGEGGGSQ